MCFYKVHRHVWIPTKHSNSRFCQDELPRDPLSRLHSAQTIPIPVFIRMCLHELNGHVWVLGLYNPSPSFYQGVLLRTPLSRSDSRSDHPNSSLCQDVLLHSPLSRLDFSSKQPTPVFVRMCYHVLHCHVWIPAKTIPIPFFVWKSFQQFNQFILFVHGGASWRR